MRPKRPPPASGRRSAQAAVAANGYEACQPATRPGFDNHHSKDFPMPLVRIDIDKAAPAERAGIIGAIVYEAMRTIAGVPEDDKFQIVTRHERGEIVYPANGYLGIHYSPDLVIIQITWNAGRSIEVKKQFYRTVADGITAKTGISGQDVFINIVEIAKENWSFGNGEMQYAS
jgi:4-oxalocrotonate tautomerase